MPDRTMPATSPRPLLFTPITIRDVTLRNRVVVAPMHQYAAERGFANDWHLMNAGRYAAGGAGLVIMGSTKVERRGCGTLGDLGLWDDAFVPGLARCVDFIRAQGAVPGIQLGHSGRKARRLRPWEGGGPLTRGGPSGPPPTVPSMQGGPVHGSGSAGPSPTGLLQGGPVHGSGPSGPSPTGPRTPEVEDWDDWELVAPSALQSPEPEPLPRALDRAEIPPLVARWGQAARRAREAGFQVLEIHGAHGYLIHQFLSPAANQRRDDYGGSDRNRMRFCLEVVEAVRAEWPAHLPLFLRLSVEDDAGWGSAESVALARLAQPLGVDVVDCSSGGMRGAPVVSAGPIGYGYQVPYAERLRREASVLSMAVGLIVHADQAEAILREGRADLVALARKLLYNPHWPMDAAQKLGADPAFALVPPAQAYWLEKRARQVREMVPSTYRA